MDPCLHPVKIQCVTEFDNSTVLTLPVPFPSWHATPSSIEHDHCPEPAYIVDSGIPLANQTQGAGGIRGMHIYSSSHQSFEGPFGEACLPFGLPHQPPTGLLSQLHIFSSPWMVQGTGTMSPSSSSRPLPDDASDVRAAPNGEGMRPVVRTGKENLGKRERCRVKQEEQRIRKKLADCTDEELEEFFSQQMTDAEMRRCIMAVLDQSNGPELREMASRVGMGLLLRERVVKATIKRETWVEECWKQWENEAAGERH